MEKHTLKYGLLICSLIMALNGFAQEIELTGTVSDSTQTPLESANVIALVKETNKLATYGITNSKGMYRISLPKGNTYTLKVSFVGFKTLSYDLTLSSDSQNSTKNFKLKEDTNQLDEVTVTYEMPVTVKGDTIVYNADSFNNGTEKKLGDILKKLPGIEINTDGQIEVEGKQVQKVMVEGKDFFDGDSKLAQENIPSDAIDKVEVLKNFSEVSQLKDVTNNEDNIALNLRLKEGKDNLWFGEIGAGIGLDDRYRIHPKLFYYSPKKSINILTDINNIGEIPFTRRDYYNFSGGIRRASEDSGTSLNLVADNLRFSNLKNNRANDIFNKFGALNFSYSVTDAWDLSGFFIYSDTETEMLEKSTLTYTSDDLVEQTEQKTLQDNRLGLVKLSSLYKPNADFQFDYDLFLKLSEQSQADELVSSFSDISNTIATAQKDDPFSVKQNANIYYTLNDKHIFASEIQYLVARENPFYNASFLGLGMNPLGRALPFSGLFPYDTNQEDYTINQNRSIETNKLDANVDYYHVLNAKNNLNLTVGGILSKQTFDSSIFQTLDDGSSNDFVGNDFNNEEVSYTFSDAFLGLQYRFITGKFTFTPSLDLHHYGLKNEQSGSAFSTEKTLLLPGLYANVQLKKSESIRFTYTRTAEFADINKLAEAYVFNNYNSLFQGNKTIENGLYENYRLSYYSFSLFNYTNVFASLNYSKKNDDIKNNIVFDQINRVSTPINSAFADQTLSANARWDRTFGKFKVNLRANVGLSSFYNVIDSVQNKAESLSQNYTASVLTNFKKWPNVEMGYQRIVNQYDNAIAVNTFYTDKPFVNVEAVFLKEFSFKSEYSFFNYADQDSTLNTYSFLDASLYYQKEDSPWEFKLSFTNLFNTPSINQDSFNQNFSRTTEYFVQPRYGLISIKYLI